jgi:hypothetical protein
MYLKTFQYFVKKITPNINIHLDVSNLLENTLNNVHILVLTLVA